MAVCRFLVSYLYTSGARLVRSKIDDVVYEECCCTSGVVHM